jgi:hypothetical protein
MERIYTDKAENQGYKVSLIENTGEIFATETQRAQRFMEYCKIWNICMKIFQKKL